MNKHLLSLCRVYKGEKENPVDKDKDEFKWYMWKIEWAATTTPAIASADDDVAEEKFKEFIRAAIGNFADEPFGGNPKPYFDKYFSY